MTSPGRPSCRGADPGSAFSVQVAEGDDGTVLRVAGELDFTVTALMDDALAGVRAVPGQYLILDASHLGFIDAAGVRLLSAADRRLRAGGGAGLAVRGAGRIVRRMFEIMQVTALIDDHPPTLGSAPAEIPQQAGKLDLARQAAGWSVTDLFVAYFALGGTAELGEVAAYLAGDPGALDVHQRDLAVQAVNERLLDLGRADRLLSFTLD